MAEAANGGSAEKVSLAEIGLRFEVDGEIATITLDRPDRRNAQTFATWSALAHIGDNLPQQVRIVVVRGEGPSFSAGIDLRMFTPEGVPGQGSFAAAAALDDSAFEELIAQVAATWSSTFRARAFRPGSNEPRLHRHFPPPTPYAPAPAARTQAVAVRRGLLRHRDSARAAR